MVYYYKVFDENENIIDFVNSFDLRYGFNGRIYSCLEAKAQYVYANEKVYRIGWLNPENPEMKGKYPLAFMEICSKEDYKKYKEQKEIIFSIPK